MRIQDNIVYGERLGDLAPGLMAFGDAGSIDDDGMFHSSVTLEPAIAEPLVRALMRAQAELLLEDAAAVGTDAADHRTHDQRAADALVRVVQEIAKATALSPA